MYGDDILVNSETTESLPVILLYIYDLYSAVLKELNLKNDSSGVNYNVRTSILIIECTYNIIIIIIYNDIMYYMFG